jgi:hypothetical protein
MRIGSGSVGVDDPPVVDIQVDKGKVRGRAVQATADLGPGAQDTFRDALVRRAFDIMIGVGENAQDGGGPVQVAVWQGGFFPAQDRHLLQAVAQADRAK